MEGVDRKQFEAEIKPLGRPVVLRNLAADWRAVRAAKQGDAALCDYLAGRANDIAGHALVAAPAVQGKFGYTPDVRGFNFERRMIDVPSLMRLLGTLLGPGQQPAVYAGCLPIPRHFGDRLDDHRTDLLDHLPDVLASIWVGNRTVTAAHWDLPQNIAVAVGGRRRFTLFPPSEIPNLYFGPLDLTPAGQPISLVDFDNPDPLAHPRFTTALRSAEVADLEPGDAIYLPSLWIHHVRSLDPVSVLVNFWWRDGPVWLDTPRSTLFHALTTLRDLPDDERLRWRDIFDHYIFRPDGTDPFAHLDDSARGVFGAMTPDRLAAIHTILARRE